VKSPKQRSEGPVRRPRDRARAWVALVPLLVCLVAGPLAAAPAARHDPSSAPRVLGPTGDVTSPPSYRIVGEDGAEIVWALTGPTPGSGRGSSPLDTGPLGQAQGEYALVAAQREGERGEFSRPAVVRFRIRAPEPPPDTTPPSGGAIGLPDLGNSRTISVALLAQSQDSAPGAIRYGLSESSTTPPQPLSAAPFPRQFTLAPGDGAHTVWLWAIDSRGNAAAVASAATVLDTVAPAVRPDSAPAAGAAGQPLTAAVAVGFSEPVRPVSDRNLSLCADPCRTPVAATVTYDADGRGARLVPAAPLAAATRYQVRLSGILDLAGNALAGLGVGTPWTFTTARAASPPAGGASAPGAPVVTQGRPAPTAGGPSTPAAGSSTGPPAASGVAPSLGRLPNARLLRPAAGSRLGTLRPTLRWRRHPGARLYNVQIFAGKRKVLSAFPRKPSLRVPAGILKPGVTYVWRVWPFARKGYTVRPLGLSAFSIRPAARR
jgi:Big-like domain-containing protein